MTTRHLPPPPPRGTCRWLGADPVTGLPVLSINGRAYEVEGSGPYRLHSLDPATFLLRTYAVDPALGICTCADAACRKRECKHVRALRAALSRRPAAT